MTTAERQLVRLAMIAMGKPPLFIDLWGAERPWDPPDAQGGFSLRDRGALLRFLMHPGMGFADGYVEGAVEVHGDLYRLLEGSFRAFEQSRSWLPLKAVELLRYTGSNSRWRARENAQHHYDLGNDFYALWLDDSMAYTCAYFRDPRDTLEAAQRAKYEHVCRKLDLRPGERVLETGCGWGGLALYAARQHGVKVRAYNVSSEQVAFATDRARREGLADRVEFIREDYRDATGQFDAFMSVGMLEHVGLDHYPTMATVLDRVLPSHGRGLIHTIGRARPMPTDAWLERRIFPGAHLPALSEITSILEPVDMAVQDVENLRPHYAQTLRHWLDRFEAHRDEVARTFDERFVRMWRMYLVGSIAAFETGWTHLYQVLFTRAQGSDLPWTRERLYAPELRKEPCA